MEERVASSMTRRSPGLGAHVIVWSALVLIVVAQVMLTYEHLPTPALVVLLLLLAALEAGLGVMYFMHLKYEHPAFRWSLISAVLFVLLMMNQLWPDAIRTRILRQPVPPPSPPPAQPPP
jgi:caa(3)-type oxidase subunit IV